MEMRYTVAQACEMIGVKSYVLRYWEDELVLHIRRNELGHRYYTGFDIQLFLNIKELKNRGLQLRAIKELIPQIARSAPGGEGSKIRLLEDSERACSENRECEKEKYEKEETEQMCTQDKIIEFQRILERLIAQEIHAKKEGEDRCRSLDAAIRRQQSARREAAAAGEKKSRRKVKVHI